MLLYLLFSSYFCFPLRFFHSFVDWWYAFLNVVVFFCKAGVIFWFLFFFGLFFSPQFVYAKYFSFLFIYFLFIVVACYWVFNCKFVLLIDFTWYFQIFQYLLQRHKYHAIAAILFIIIIVVAAVVFVCVIICCACCSFYFCFFVLYFIDIYH